MTTTNPTIELGGLTVEVSDAGEDIAPWGDSTVYKYAVTVRARGGEVHTSDAWGSIYDFQQGARDFDGIGWMVLDELLSAAYDPDEFFAMATEGEGGRARAVKVLELITTAEAMLPLLEANQAAIEAGRDR